MANNEINKSSYVLKYDDDKDISDGYTFNTSNKITEL